MILLRESAKAVSYTHLIAVSVQLEPVPAMTGTRLATCSTVKRIASRCSSWLSVDDSPVVPHCLLYTSRCV